MVAKKKKEPEKDYQGRSGSMQDDTEKNITHSTEIPPSFSGQTSKHRNHKLQIHQIELQTQAEDLRRLKLALEESRDKYLNLYDFAPIGYLTLTDKGLITEVNLTGAMLLDVDRNNLVRAQFSKFIAEKDYNQWHRYFVNLLEPGVKQTCTLMLKKGDGSTFPARLEGLRIPISNGSVTVHIAISNIKDIRDLEEASRESAERFHGIFNMINDGIHIHEIEPDGKPGKFIEVNEVACKMLDYTHKELLELGPLDLVTGYHSRPFNEIIGELSSIGHTIFKTGHRRKDGTIIPVEINAHKVSLQGKQLIVSVVRDITERKLVEKQAQLAVEEWERTFNAVPDLISILDTQHKIRRVNTAMARKLGVTPEDAMGLICYQHVHGTQSPPDFCPHTMLLKDQQEHAVEIYEERLGGHFLITCTPLHDTGGQLLGSVHIARDITGRKKTEKDLHDLTLELETRVLQRTEALEQEILQRKTAEATIKSSLNEKEILLREIHHRVKNNLQIITSLIRLQKQQITDLDTINVLQDSESRIRSMALVHEKLYSSKDLTSIDFTDYIRTLSSGLINAYAVDPHLIRLVIDVKNVSLDINRAIPAGLIMNELVANALKHAFPKGQKGEIAITGRSTPTGIVLSVQDNGVGLPDELDWRNTSTLGLQLVITLIRQLQGSIELNRAGGTTFVMNIPSAYDETS